MQCTKAFQSVEPKYYTRLGASGLPPLLGFDIDARMIRTSSCGRIPSHVHRRSRRPATNPAVGIFRTDPYQVAAMNIIWVPTFVVRTVQPVRLLVNDRKFLAGNSVFLSHQTS